MWRIFSDFGLYSICPNDDSEEGGLRRHEDLPKPLDPIEVAGQCRLGVCRKMAVELDATFGIQAVDAVEKSNPELWKDGTGPTALNEHRPTSNQRYGSHMLELESAKVVKEETGPAGLRFINGYFSVAKDEEWDRAILNAKALNKHFVTPPPVNLQPVTEAFILLTILMASANKGECVAFVCDLRHWFHQIKVGTYLSSFFGVHTSATEDRGCGRYYRWLTLPMGWSWSPRICQSIAWSVILWHKQPTSNEDGMAYARRSVRSLKDPPRYVQLRRNDGTFVGFISLTYDNVFLFCVDREIGLAAKSKIMKNFSLANIAVKQSSLRLAMNDPRPDAEAYSLVMKDLSTTGKADEDEDHGGICHLGVQFAAKFIIDEWRIQWRHEPKRTQKWKLYKLALTQPTTRRFIARVCGVILWHLTILLRALCFATSLIEILRKVAVPDRQRWDDVIELSLRERSYLDEELRLATQNEWVTGTLPVPRTAREYIVFSDASKTAMGGVLCSEDGTVRDVWPRPFPKDFQKSHIYLKELGAVIWLIYAYVETLELHDTIITVVVDNSAAYFSLVNRYSANRHACHWLRKLEALLINRNIELDLVLVVSADNPADCPSRGLSTVDPDRLRRGLLAVKYHRDGKRFSSHKTENPLDEGLRHRTPMNNASTSHTEEELDELFLQMLDPLVGMEDSEDPPPWPAMKRVRSTD